MRDLQLLLKGVERNAAPDLWAAIEHWEPGSTEGATSSTRRRFAAAAVAFAVVAVAAFVAWRVSERPLEHTPEPGTPGPVTPGAFPQELAKGTANGGLVDWELVTVREGNRTWL